RLHTMGFRGEALPSICAIAKVELKSRTADSEMGTQLIINGSKVESQTPCVCDKGTSISVRNLFFNVPARRKFLKSDNVELSNVMREFERLALVNNHIRMSIDTGTRQLDLRAASLHQRINDLWKNNLKMDLLPVEVDTQLVKIHGFVSRPEFARRRNALQFLIVNGRNMRHPYFHKAIVSCFDGLIATDTQPCYFLKFEVDPATIDVNIHPTKNEIKFEFESEIWPLLVAGVKASLGKNSAIPSIDFNSDAVPVSPLPLGEHPDRPTMELPPDYNPFNAGYSAREISNQRNWNKLYSDFMNTERENLTDESDFSPLGFENSDTTPNLPGMEEEPANVGSLCMQFALKYIITATRSGLLIIDQHRAHIKVLYEKYLATALSGTRVAQRVMFAESISLDATRQAALQEVQNDLDRLGFELEYEEEDRWRITALPVGLHGDPGDIIMRILDSVSEDSHNYGADQQPVNDIMQRIALVMARGAAITRGRKLTDAEMENLIGQLFSLPAPTYT
ncbi:MAG: DNA mismatch repair endonuclease MutL, partial [Muribaculaceae bacterium]|nr:DNA mismatch repair endonuclease MutL [Muribaculaceae bacterium]